MLTIKAPAKINWFLRVTGKRPDGFHDIHSLMQCVSLFDTLTFEQADTLELQCDSDIPTEQNLVYKAALALKETSCFEGGARISLEKRIPLAAGLGGGSSDAATTLLGLNDLWGLNLGIERLSEIGAALGSDIPFFIFGGPAVASGRGEVLEPVLRGPSAAVALIKPSFGVSAGQAYGGVKQYSQGRPDDAQKLIEAADNGDTKGLRELMVNDLEPPVISAHPIIETIKQSLIDNGAMAALMSGSGSTVFGVFTDESLAARSISHLSENPNEKLWAEVARTV